MTLIYQLLILFFTLAWLPVFFLEYIKKKKYRGHLKEKLGLTSISYKSGHPVIWVHAVSVGEVKAVKPLLKKLKDTYPSSLIVVSSVTTTGLNEAQKSLPFADHHTLMPVDFKPAVKRLLGNLKIDLLVLVEGDLWPNFIRSCKASGAKVIIVNGKISERSFRRLKKLPMFAKWYLSPIDSLLVQDQVYFSRFESLGFSPDKMKVIPNIKLDDIYPELETQEKESLIKKFGLKGFVITLGSTHENEEVKLLHEIAPLFEIYPDLKVLLVPRHPDRNDEVEQIVKGMSLTCLRYSREENFDKAQVILIDVMGFLRTCYELSTIAVVAGSFTSKVGGHNILEPFWYKVPSIYGPHMYTQAQFVHMAEVSKAGIQTEIKFLREKIEKLLKNQNERALLGSRGRQIFDDASGGTEVTYNFIKKTLER